MYVYVLLPHFYLEGKVLSETMFLPLVPVDGVEYFFGGKGMFLCFMFSRIVPVDCGHGPILQDQCNKDRAIFQ